VNSAEWKSNWALIRGSWPLAALADPVVEKAWRAGLSDLEPKDLADAIRAEMRGSERLPSVAAIRKAANEAARDRRLVQEGEHMKLDAPIAPIPEEFRGGWHTVKQTLAESIDHHVGGR